MPRQYSRQYNYRLEILTLTDSHPKEVLEHLDKALNMYLGYCEGTDLLENQIIKEDLERLHRAIKRQME